MVCCRGQTVQKSSRKTRGGLAESLQKESAHEIQPCPPRGEHGIVGGPLQGKLEIGQVLLNFDRPPSTQQLPAKTVTRTERIQALGQRPCVILLDYLPIVRLQGLVPQEVIDFRDGQPSSRQEPTRPAVQGLIDVREVSGRETQPYAIGTGLREIQV
jgi:hypothetical protein